MIINNIYRDSHSEIVTNAFEVANVATFVRPIPFSPCEAAVFAGSS